MAFGLDWTSVCLCILISVLIMDRMGLFNKNHFPVESRVKQSLLMLRSKLTIIL